MNNRGFSLVEVLVAIPIAAFLVTAVWTSFLLGTFTVNSTRHTAQAMHLCESRVEAMQAKTQGELQSLLGQTIAEQVSLDYSEDKSSAIWCTRTTTVTDDDADNVYEATVTVTWTERYLGGTKTRTVVLNTQIAKITI